MSEEKLKVLLLSNSDLDIWNKIFDYMWESERDNYYEDFDEKDFKKEDHPFYWIHQMEDWFSQVNYKTKKFYDYELEEKTEVENFVMMSMSYEYTRDKMIKRFPKLSNPKVMKEFTSGKWFGDVYGDTMYLRNNFDKPFDMFLTDTDKNWITTIFDNDEDELEKEIDDIDLKVKQKQNTKVLNKWTK